MWSCHISEMDPRESLQRKIIACKKELGIWQQGGAGYNTKKEIQALEKSLEVHQGSDGGFDMEEMESKKQKLQFLLDQEDLKWRQRAKNGVAQWRRS